MQFSNYFLISNLINPFKVPVITISIIFPNLFVTLEAAKLPVKTASSSTVKGLNEVNGVSGTTGDGCRLYQEGC